MNPVPLFMKLPAGTVYAGLCLILWTNVKIDSALLPVQKEHCLGLNKEDFVGNLWLPRGALPSSSGDCFMGLQ